jgi:predicted phosphodiesterase
VWAAAVDKIVNLQPDLVLVGGDIVDHPHVSSYAVKAWRDGVRRVVTETGAHLVAVAGNHDVGRTKDVLTPIVMPDDYDRVHIVTEPKRVRIQLADELVSIAAFPFTALTNGETYAIESEEGATNVLLLHAAVRGDAEGDKLPWFYQGERALDIGREAERFDIIACGDYHEFTRLHPTALACYPGSLERVSTNIWKEAGEKGFVLADTKAGTLRFHELPTREMVDYDPAAFDLAPGAGAVAVNRVLAAIAENPREGAIMRLKLDAFPREERGDIDQALVREIKKRCLHFELDLRLKKRESVDLGDVREREGRRISVSHEAEAFFQGDPPAVRAVVFEHLGVQEGVGV